MDFDNSTDTITPDAVGDAVITIAGTGGLKVPVGTTAERPADTLGLLRFNTTINNLEFNFGGGWSVAGGGSLSSDPTITGTSGMVIPIGTQAQEVGTTNGAIRYNSDTSKFKGRAGGSWVNFVTEGAALTSPLVLAMQTTTGEGGELNLQKSTSSTLAADVAIDLLDQTVRIFENGGTFRGVRLDLTTVPGGVTANILTSASGTYSGTLTSLQVTNALGFTPSSGGGGANSNGLTYTISRGMCLQ